MLDTDISNAIKQNLPAMVGDELQKRLAQASKDAILLGIVQSDLERVISERDKLVRLNIDAERVIASQAEIVAKLAEIKFREEVVKIKEEFMKERLADLRGVVKDVFSNNRLKYSEMGMAPAGVSPNGGYATGVSAPFNREITSEG